MLRVPDRPVPGSRFVIGRRATEAVPGATRRPRTVTLVVLAIITSLALSALATAAPDPVLAATTLAARCDIGLRIKPSTSATRLARIPAGTRITAETKVSGGRWSRTCVGIERSGRGWYKISRIDGTSVKSLYGVRYVYGPGGLFKAAADPAPAWVACDRTRLKTGPDSSTTTNVILPAWAKVTTFGTVTGEDWSTTCTGIATTGSAWHRITAIDGTSVWQLYGRTVLYAPKGRFVNTAPFVEGIDVSHWQGTIDWALVAGAGKRFAFLKASDSVDYVDPTYATNRSKAKANGLHVGAYHFARPDATPGDAEAEADHFVDTAGPAPGELLPVLDLERTGGLSTAALQVWVRAFLGRVYDRTGIRAMIYTSPSFWASYMGNTAWFAANGYRILWIAHWTTAASPRVPADNWNGQGWTFWQYTSDGRVPGISGRVDLDRYRFTDFTPVLVE